MQLDLKLGSRPLHLRYLGMTEHVDHDEVEEPEEETETIADCAENDVSSCVFEATCPVGKNSFKKDVLYFTQSYCGIDFFLLFRT